MDVIEALRRQVSQDREAVKARDVMIDILEEAVARLKAAGFTPTLQLGLDGELVFLRLDATAWAVRGAGDLGQSAVYGTFVRKVYPNVA